MQASHTESLFNKGQEITKNVEEFKFIIWVKIFLAVEVSHVNSQSALFTPKVKCKNLMHFYTRPENPLNKDNFINDLWWSYSVNCSTDLFRITKYIEKNPSVSKDEKVI